VVVPLTLTSHDWRLEVGDIVFVLDQNEELGWCRGRKQSACADEHGDEQIDSRCFWFPRAHVAPAEKKVLTIRDVTPTSSCQQRLKLSCTNLAGEVVATLDSRPFDTVRAFGLAVAAQLGVSRDCLSLTLPCAKLLGETNADTSLAKLFSMQPALMHRQPLAVQQQPNVQFPIPARVIVQHCALDDDQLDLHVADIVIVLEVDVSGWCGGYRVCETRAGWFPGTCVVLLPFEPGIAIEKHRAQPRAHRANQHQSGVQVRNCPLQLSLDIGDEVLVIEKEEETGWCLGCKKSSGEAGYFLASCVRLRSAVS